LNMEIITAKELRANQKKYLDMAAEEPVFIMRRNARPVVLTSADDFYVPTKDELLAIQKGLNDIEEGKGTKIKDPKNIWESIL
jgi:PHD/YefM family antitoxin component YafN of YafNO toxin-antitoxin module